MLFNTTNYILSNRQVDENGKLKPKEINPHPSGKLYYGIYKFPVKRNHTKHDTVKVRELTDNVQQEFINTIVNDISQSLQHRRDVLFYIHGYYPEDIKTLRLHLLYDVYHEYVDKPMGPCDDQHICPSIFKIIYFTWPATGKRHELDDRAFKMGENMFAYYDFFTELSKKLAAVGSRLHLIAHSFSHHLLNGFLSKLMHQQWKQKEHKIFDQAFLVGSDVSHRCIAVDPNDPKKNGITIPNGNYHAPMHYDLTKLKYTAKQVHIFYDQWDYLLYISTKRQFKTFPRQNIINTQDFICLGNFGPGKKQHFETDYHYYNIINPHDPDKFKQDDLPRVVPHTQETILNQVFHTNFSFNTIKNLPGLHVVNRTLTRHRAFYCGKACIARVLQIINKAHKPAQNPVAPGPV